MLDVKDIIYIIGMAAAGGGSFFHTKYKADRANERIDTLEDNMEKLEKKLDRHNETSQSHFSDLKRDLAVIKFKLGIKNDEIG